MHSPVVMSSLAEQQMTHPSKLTILRESGMYFLACNTESHNGDVHAATAHQCQSANHSATDLCYFDELQLV
jgi:hypothetical protein